MLIVGGVIKFLNCTHELGNFILCEIYRVTKLTKINKQNNIKQFLIQRVWGGAQELAFLTIPNNF